MIMMNGVKKDKPVKLNLDDQISRGQVTKKKPYLIETRQKLAINPSLLFE